MSNLHKRKKIDGRYLIEEVNSDISFYKFIDKKQIFNFLVKGEKNEYFKANGRHSFDVSELFACAIANAAGYKIVEQFPAVYIDKKGKQYQGVISEDYIKDREKVEVILSAIVLKTYFNNNVLRVEENAIENHYNAAKAYIKNINKIKNKKDKKLELDNNFVKDLQKLRLFGFLIGTEDLWPNNIEFFIENNILKVSTPLDFSYSFLIKSFSSNLRINFRDGLSQKEKQELVENKLELINMPFKVFSENAEDNNRFTAAQETAKMLLMDDELKEFYNNFKKLDVKQVLTTWQKNNEYNFIEDEDIELASLVVKTSIKQIEQALENEIIVQNSPLYKISKQSEKFNNREFLTYYKTKNYEIEL
ncbi:MAG: hypothetical protein CVV59_01045 [Tenericutes bacterium HGW-Tenericutes-4]|jgi:hypothetical protein|nr:MAG: hypothetical protein CVV59_01045 [Tenericutes bacterium HGW-Tenericutes-4]